MLGLIGDPYDPLLVLLPELGQSLQMGVRFLAVVGEVEQLERIYAPIGVREDVSDGTGQDDGLHHDLQRIADRCVHQSV